jgi:hypothetical protein
MPEKTTCSDRSASLDNTIDDSSVSFAKVATLPRCRGSMTSTTVPMTSLVRTTIGIDDCQSSLPTHRTFNSQVTTHDESSMPSLFQPISLDNGSSFSNVDNEPWKSTIRPSLEVVPELSELNIDPNRIIYSSSSSSQVVQPSPVLTTFESAAIHRHR